MIKNKNNLLFAAVLVLFALVGFRMLYSGAVSYIFLLWNTFLASVPFALSEIMAKHNFSKFKNVLIGLACILFLPNALYLISDFEHLHERPGVPFFFDILLMFYAALIGLLLNVSALKNLQNVLARYFETRSTNVLICAIILLSGFGVYLGRYLRWNSWDLLTRPKPLLIECFYHSLHPNLFTYTWSVSIGYAFVLGFGYLFFTKMIQND
jgi:uncharacterized membrane protein